MNNPAYETPDAELAKRVAAALIDAGVDYVLMVYENTYRIETSEASGFELFRVAGNC